MFEQLRRIDVRTVNTAAGFLRFNDFRSGTRAISSSETLHCWHKHTRRSFWLMMIFRLCSIVISTTGHRARYRDEIFNDTAENAPWMSLAAYLAPLAANRVSRNRCRVAVSTLCFGQFRPKLGQQWKSLPTKITFSHRSGTAQPFLKVESVSSRQQLEAISRTNFNIHR